MNSAGLLPDIVSLEPTRTAENTILQASGRAGVTVFELARRPGHVPADDRAPLRCPDRRRPRGIVARQDTLEAAAEREVESAAGE